MRPKPAVLFVSVLVAGAAAMSAAQSPRDPDRAVSLTMRERPGASLPVSRVEHYRMAGRIRPLLFWIGRDNVGMGRIVWRRGPSGEVAYELLIGTDPALAPRKLNRWGYIAEEIEGRDGRFLAIISKSEERSVGEVRPGLGDDGRRHAFSTIRATVRGGRSDATTWTARTQDNLTLRDVERVLTAVERAHDDAQHHDRVVPDGVRPGFLAAVADLIDLSIGAHHTSPAAVEALRQVPVPYVYGDSIHDLSLRSHAFQRRMIDSQLVTTIHGKFETRKRLTGKATRFEVSYGLDGCLAGIPVSIRYQPRWWLRVELFREHDSGSPIAVAPDAAPPTSDGDCR